MKKLVHYLHCLQASANPRRCRRILCAIQRLVSQVVLHIISGFHILSHCCDIVSSRCTGKRKALNYEAVVKQVIHSNHIPSTYRQMRTIQPMDPALRVAFADNKVVNSRYTVANFVFKNLYEQFRRPLNFYFLIVALLQFISIISPVSPLSTVLPLLFAFTLTAVKEGYDDVKRHRQDATYNAKRRLVLNAEKGEWCYKQNEHICVGDVLLLQQNEEIPCDVVVIAASAPTVFIRTDNLDGEIDLKVKNLVRCPPTGSRTGEEQAASPPTASDTTVISLTDAVPELLVKLSRLKLHCPPPNAMVESFDGVAEFTVHPCTKLEANGAMRNCDISSETASVAPSLYRVSLSHTHLLPQSCLLKNTERVMAVAVYTGAETKCGMNTRPSPAKWAQIDQQVNTYSIFIFGGQIVTATIFGFLGYCMNTNIEWWYLPKHHLSPSVYLIIYPLRFFLLTTVMIPVSFKFVVDMSKHYIAEVVECDEALKHENGEGCRVKNSSIVEDLGQIDYVLSDKTGTLTQNVMELRYISVVPDHQLELTEMDVPASMLSSPTVANSSVLPFREKYNGGADDLSHPPKGCVRSPEILHFSTMMALCSTVEVVRTKRSTDLNDTVVTNMYQAASPDEVALCFGAAKTGVLLESRSPESATVTVCGETEKWPIHHLFPFSSDRKSMGIITENPRTNQLLLVMKGADDCIQRMLRHDRCFSAFPMLGEHLSLYAKSGLRTLLFAQKEITRKELQEFLASMREAELSMSDRQAVVDALRDQMECDMELIGITANEDKLQENVRETVQDLHEAGVKMWMLTGDKIETAEQIGLSCSLFNANDRIIRIVDDPINGVGWEEKLMSFPTTGHSRTPERNQVALSPYTLLAIGKYIMQKVMFYGTSKIPFDPLETDQSSSSARTALVVHGGPVLQKILTTERLACRFMEISNECQSVICARTTPSQKAAVTNFVRTQGHMTLSIGDGGNDVAMLQAAHVGVGIAGKEGQQAARAADFSIQKFSDLRPLMFVHGHQAYARTAYIIKYSFYKSMLIAFIQLAYNVVGANYSGGSFWNSFSLMMWNGCYTLPTTLLYCLDRCAPRVVLEHVPALYKLSRRSTDMAIPEFFLFYVLRGAVQSVALLWFATSVYGISFKYADGGTESNSTTFSVSYTALIISQLLTVYMESHSVTYWNALFLLGMPLFYVLATYVFSSIPHLEYFGVFQRTLGPEGLLAAFGIAAALVIPCLLCLTIREASSPNCHDVLRRSELKRQKKLMAMKSYSSCQSWWVRWAGCTSESPSSFIHYRGFPSEDYLTDETITV